VKRSILVGGALALGVGAVTLGAAAQAPVTQVKEPNTWLKSFEAAQTASRQSGMPIFLVFR
jgi:hypothetical protein